MEYETDRYHIECIDGIEGIKKLKDKSVKLMYGSPPYPNAKRDYCIWSTEEYLGKIIPFIKAVLPKLTDDGFIVINVKSNRERGDDSHSSRRSLVVEKLAIALEEELNLYCVDIEIWIKSNPVPTGNRSSCQDAYEQNLWFSKSPKWSINIDAIRRPYDPDTLKMYENNTFKPRRTGTKYVSKVKKIKPNPLGALPLNITYIDPVNIIYGGVSSKTQNHQAVQPAYLPAKYIKATTKEGDLVLDPWMGSGTTAQVAIELNRRFVGFDIYPDYVTLALNNINNLEIK